MVSYHKTKTHVHHAWFMVVLLQCFLSLSLPLSLSLCLSLSLSLPLSVCVSFSLTALPFSLISNTTNTLHELHCTVRSLRQTRELAEQAVSRVIKRQINAVLFTLPSTTTSTSISSINTYVRTSAEPHQNTAKHTQWQTPLPRHHRMSRGMCSNSGIWSRGSSFPVEHRVWECLQ